MATEWITVDPFVDGALVRVNKIQAMWENLQSLANANLAEQQGPAYDGTAIQITGGPSSTFQDMDSTYYRQTFDSYGGDLLITVDLTAIYTVASITTGIAYRFMLDGVALGNNSGLGQWTANTVQETFQLIYIAKNIAAGSHTCVLQWFNEGSGNAGNYKYPVNLFDIMEFD